MSLNPSESFRKFSNLDAIVDKIIVPIRSTYKAQFPRCSFTRGIANLTLMTADERAGVAFVLALVAASKPGSDSMLAKAATWIENAAKRGERVNAEIDDDGNLLEELDVGDDDEEEIVSVDSLCLQKTCWKCLNCYWHSMLGIKEDTHFHYKMTKKNWRCNKKSGL